MILLIRLIIDWMQEESVIINFVISNFISFKKDTNNKIYSIYVYMYLEKKNLIKYFINNEALFTSKNIDQIKYS